MGGNMDMETPFEYKNVCKKCGAVNTLEPYYIGRKCVHRCNEDAGGCGQISKGITRIEAIELGIKIKDVDVSENLRKIIESRKKLFV